MRVVGYLWVLLFILAISIDLYEYQYFRTGHPVSPGNYPPWVGCCRLSMGTTFHFSYKPSIFPSICTSTSSCEVGTPSFSGHFHSISILTQVHSIMASSGIYPPKAWCRLLHLGTSFHSSYKASIFLSIYTSTSTCDVDTPSFSGHFHSSLTQVHSIVVSPGILPA